MSRLDWYNVVKFLHVGFVVFGFGPTIAMAVLGARVQRIGGPARLPFTEAIYDLARRLVTPLAGLVLITGLVDVTIGRPLFAWRLGQSWLWVSLVLWVVGMALAEGVLAPTYKRMIAVQVDHGGALTDADVAEVERLGRRAAAVGGVNHLVLTLIIFLMVWKPGA